ncbi:MAG: hypothetical protein WA015_20770 [Bryobacteraceae bacterium]|jgi:hypothetical protein
MLSNGLVGTAFHEGDEVVLAKGSYQGTLGEFVRLKKDVNWADIKERNGSIRSHPVAWLAPSTKVAWGNQEQ